MVVVYLPCRPAAESVLHGRRLLHLFSCRAPRKIVRALACFVLVRQRFKDLSRLLELAQVVLRIRAGQVSQASRPGRGGRTLNMACCS